jgi:sphinganine-1-phosphate aldolase
MDLGSNRKGSVRFPQVGAGAQDLKQVLSDLRAGDSNPLATFSDRWLNDRDLLVDDGVIDVAKAAYMAFFTKNNSYPPILLLEHELVGMALDLFHGGPSSTGSVTSGGSESLFLAAAAALAHAKSRNRLPKNPEILVAKTGYPAFEKYGRYLGYSVRRAPIDEYFRADASAMAQLINEQTVMIAASYPSWAHGACDPIPELAEIAFAGDVWLHVDACVGGFLAPFVRDLGRHLPNFDFRLRGVASISSDFHKYGYSAKGVSGVFYRDRALAEHQVFVFDEWSAGLYRSPVFAGTRSGGSIASAWAVMNYLGKDGYSRRAVQILKLRDALVDFAKTTPGLCLLGQAELGTVAIGSGPNVDVYTVADDLRRRGWSIGLLKDPPAIQFVLGPLRDDFIIRLITDLREATSGSIRRDPFACRPSVVYSDEVLDLPCSIVHRTARS